VIKTNTPIRRNDRLDTLSKDTKNAAYQRMKLSDTRGPPLMPFIAVARSEAGADTASPKATRQ